MSFARRFVLVVPEYILIKPILIDRIGTSFKDITQSTVVTPTNKKSPP